MLRREVIPVWIGVILLLGILLMGQDCAAQCDPDPCEGIPNALAGTCMEIGGPCVGPSDFSCSCDPGYTWQQGTHTCQGSSSGLPDTGITQCYDNTQVIECPSPGQPFYGQDAQYVTNPMSFTVSQDGFTVTDNVTDLMWQREDDNARRTWADAISYCEGLSLGGHEDWRLPDEYELQSIAHYGRKDPAIDTTVFPGTDLSSYWSSSTYAENTLWAWIVWFDKSCVSDNPKTSINYVRCVRGVSIVRSFTDNLDGTVTDNVTGLKWQWEDDNQTRNWESALAYCEDLNLAGHSDWRLPDIKELRSIVDNTRSDPAIDTTVFPGTKSDTYWSSSAPAFDVTGAWRVFFGEGSISWTHKMSTSIYVRCVR